MVQYHIVLEIGERSDGRNVHIWLESEELAIIIILYCEIADMEMLHYHPEEFTVNLSSIMSQINDDI